MLEGGYRKDRDGATPPVQGGFPAPPEWLSEAEAKLWATFPRPAWIGETDQHAVNAAVSLLALAAAKKLQVGHWKDEVSLYAHALEVTEGNWLAHNRHLGMALTRGGRGDEAIAQFAAAVRLRPEWGKPRVNLGEALLRRGEAAEALRQFQTALVGAAAGGCAPSTSSLILANPPRESSRIMRILPKSSSRLQ